MNPRPLDPEPEPFGPSLALAREGRHADAVSGVVRTLATADAPLRHRASGALALGNVAKMAEAAGDLATAERALSEAVRIAPRFPDLQYRHACVLVAQGRHADARAALELALGINPRYLAARVELALIDARDGRLAEALAALRRLGEDRPLEQPRLFREGLESLEHADWAEAGTRLKRALRIGDPSREEIVERFHRLTADGDREGARIWMRDALRRHETHPDLHCLLGTLELEEGHVDDALCSLARALEIHPGYHAARVQFARVLEAMGDVAQASEQVGYVLDEDPTNPQAMQLQERWKRRRSQRRRGAPVEARKAS